MTISSTSTLSIAEIRSEFGPDYIISPAGTGSTLTLVYPHSVTIAGELNYTGDITIWSLYGDVTLTGTITSTGGSINIRAKRKIKYYRLVANQNVRLVSDYQMPLQSTDDGPITKEFTLGGVGPEASSAGVKWYQMGFGVWAEGQALPYSVTPAITNTPVIAPFVPQGLISYTSSEVNVIFDGRTFNMCFSTDPVTMEPNLTDPRTYFDSLSYEVSSSDSIPLTDYYRGGLYVDDISKNASIPVSGGISISDFYGTGNDIYESTGTVFGNSTSVVYAPPGAVNLMVRMVGGGGGPGGRDAGGGGAVGGAGTSLAVRFLLNSTTRKKFVFVGADGGTGGRGDDNNGWGGPGGAGWLTGGTGGTSGNMGSSGSGGGGGGATAIQYYPDASINSYVLLAACGGGGGGAGKGASYNVTSSGALPNLIPRGLTHDYNDFGTITISAIETQRIAAWNAYRSSGTYPPSNLRAAGRVVPTLTGQGYSNRTNYYPPGSDSVLSNIDIGGSGGAGAGNGIPGGIIDWYWAEVAGESGSVWRWEPPMEEGGLGGNNGYVYINPGVTQYDVTYSPDSNSVFGTLYGGETPSLNQTFQPVGQPGAVCWKLTIDPTDISLPPLQNA